MSKQMIDLDDAEKEEHHEQESAQITALACEIPAEAIRVGIFKTIIALRKKPKTLYDYNKERKRDFRYGIPTHAEDVVEQATNSLERSSKANYSLFYSDPLPYVRDYKHESFQDAVKRIHRKFASFQMIRIIDVSGQLLGDVRVAQLAECIRKSPVTALALADNEITDVGMASLAACLRSLSHLSDLNLSSNHFTDDGVKSILDELAYPPNLKSIDLSRNLIHLKSAYYIGCTFHFRSCKIDSLRLGGRIGKKAWGDEFLKTLVSLLTEQGARSLKQLSLPDAGLTDDGITSLCALIVHSNTVEDINISSNSLVSPISKRFLRLSLRHNQSIKHIQIARCGLNPRERNVMKDAVASKFSLDWRELASLSQFIVKGLTDCAKLKYSIELSILNCWQKLPPIPWQEEKVRLCHKDMQLLMTESAAAKTAVLSSPFLLPALQGCDRNCAYLDLLEDAFKTTCRDLDRLLGVVPQVESDTGETNSKFEMQGDVLKRAALMEDEFVKSAMSGRELCRRDKSSSSSSLVELQGTLDRVAATILSRAKRAKNKSKSKKGSAGAGLWSKASAAATIEIDALMMAAEDCYANQINYSQSLALCIGQVHVACMAHRRQQEPQGGTNFTRLIEIRGAGEANDDGSVISSRSLVTTQRSQVSKSARGNATARSVSSQVSDEVGGAAKKDTRMTDILRFMPYYGSIGPAGGYAHFVFVWWPDETERENRSLMAFQRDQMKQRVVEERHLRRINSPKKLGKRFEIRRMQKARVRVIERAPELQPLGWFSRLRGSGSTPTPSGPGAGIGIGTATIVEAEDSCCFPRPFSRSKIVGVADSDGLIGDRHVDTQVIVSSRVEVDEQTLEDAALGGGGAVPWTATSKATDGYGGLEGSDQDGDQDENVDDLDTREETPAGEAEDDDGMLGSLASMESLTGAESLVLVDDPESVEDIENVMVPTSITQFRILKNALEGRFGAFIITMLDYNRLLVAQSRSARRFAICPYNFDQLHQNASMDAMGQQIYALGLEHSPFLGSSAAVGSPAPSVKGRMTSTASSRGSTESRGASASSGAGILAQETLPIHRMILEEEFDRSEAMPSLLNLGASTRNKVALEERIVVRKMKRVEMRERELLPESMF